MSLHIDQMKVLPSRVARQVTALARRGSVRADGFEAVLVAAESLAPMLQQGSSTSDEQLEAAERAKDILSTCAAQALSDMPVVDARQQMPRVARCLEQSLLNSEPVIQGMLAGAMNSVHPPTDNGPGSNGIRWHEVEGFVDYAMTLAKHEVLVAVSMEMAPHSAQQILDAVQLSPVEQLPVSLRRAFQLTSAWQSANYHLVALLKDWLLQRLQQLAARAATDWADEEPSSPTSPSSSARGLPRIVPGSPVARGRPWVDTLWWLQVLRTAAINGLLQRSSLLELCELLTTGFAMSGMRIVEASVMLRNPLHAARKDVGSTVVARGLALELAANPETVRYLPHMRLVLCNCPPFPGDAAESIVLNLDAESKEARGSSQSPLASTTTSSWRRRPPRPDSPASPVSQTSSGWRGRPPRADEGGRGRAIVRAASTGARLGPRA